MQQNLNEAQRHCLGRAVKEIFVSEDHVFRHNSHTISVSVRLGPAQAVDFNLGTFALNTSKDAVRQWAAEAAANKGAALRFSESSD
ncbi:MAG: hypothetical protein HQK55_18790 [Deltaproteobacteria bacterium]|nr:hypothetical protein [Deltaproteobacteria bacterium]